MKASVLLLILFIVLGAPSAASGQFSLWLVEKRLEIKYSVPNITHRELGAKLNAKTSSGYMLFDVREKPEYDVSHLQSAYYVDPEMKTDAFITAFGDRIRGKKLVFYCSVGDRSSHFIERVRQKALAAGALGLFNLRGGIFRWYNEGHPVVDESGETDAVHPYDEDWGKLLHLRSKENGEGLR